jgi:hypothetical protein
MHVGILAHHGNVVFDKNLPCHFDTLLQAIAPFRDGIVIGVECLFGWYWLADRCAEHDIPFVVGHALYMRLIHGAKANRTRGRSSIDREMSIELRPLRPLIRPYPAPLSGPYPAAAIQLAALAGHLHVAE